MSKEIFKLEGTIEIDNSGANKSIDETTEKAQELSEAIEGTGKSADSAGKSMGSSSKFGAGSVWLGNMLTALTTSAFNVGKAISKTGFKQNTEMEKYTASISTMLGGNSEAAQKLITDLQELASVTPLNTSGLVKNTSKLIGAKVPLEDIVDTMRMLGDVSGGNQDYFDGIVRAYSQVMSATRLTTEDLNQFVDREVPIWQMIADYLEIDQSQVRSMVSKAELPASVLTETLKKETSENGLYYQQMEKQAETFSGKISTLQDNAEITAGQLTKPFFDMAKSDVLPKLTESLERFGTWAISNQEALTKIADGMGKFATITFDGVLEFFKWLTENGEAVATAIGVIGTAMGIAAATAHPYAAAVSAIAGALMYLNSETGKKRGTFDHMFDGYTESDIETLNRYVDALNAMREAEDVSLDTWDADKMAQARAVYDAALAEVTAIDGLKATYDTWHSAQAGYAGANGPALKVGLQIAEDAESIMQGDIDGMNFSATVKMYADTSSLNTTYSYAPSVDGSHAGGLDFVPRDNYIARLHKGEQVLTRSQADAYRNGMGSQDIGRLETAINQLAVMMQQVANNTRGGQMVVLDSGAVVGQLAPMMDAQLGAISGRKGRRN